MNKKENISCSARFELLGAAYIAQADEAIAACVWSSKSYPENCSTDYKHTVESVRRLKNRAQLLSDYEKLIDKDLQSARSDDDSKQNLKFKARAVNKIRFLQKISQVHLHVARFHHFARIKHFNELDSVDENPEDEINSARRCVVVAKQIKLLISRENDGEDADSCVYPNRWDLDYELQRYYYGEKGKKWRIHYDSLSDEDLYSESGEDDDDHEDDEVDNECNSWWVAKNNMKSSRRLEYYNSKNRYYIKKFQKGRVAKMKSHEEAFLADTLENRRLFK
jgi:hypothetical protein